MARKNLDVLKLTSKTWVDLRTELEADGFFVDHYHGMIETKNDSGQTFEDLVHIDAHSGMMDSTLMGVGSEQPEDFVSLNADEWHE